MAGSQHPVDDHRVELLSDFEALLRDFPTSKLQTVSRFLTDVVETESVVTIEAFLTWKDHQVIDTILLLLADMELGEQENIMAAVRDLVTESQTA